MNWINRFNLFLFDFDGLLVNTEELHFLAYKMMCKKHGFDLDWTFERYCESAHYSADILKKELYEKFPTLIDIEPSWDLLYQQKKEIIVKLLKEGRAELMPGVEELLSALKAKNIPSVVVTHSSNELTELLIAKHPILKTISHWVTRKDYHHPKPNSECYEKAIFLYGKDCEKIIGFEDTPRGLTALMPTRALPVLVCKANYPEIPAFIAKGVKHFRSFSSIKESDFNSKLP